MSRITGTRPWLAVIIALVGAVLGEFIGYVTRNISWLSWLNYGKKLGFTDPFTLDLDFITITFGFSVQITIAGILGLILAIIIYRLVNR